MQCRGNASLSGPDEAIERFDREQPRLFPEGVDSTSDTISTSQRHDVLKPKRPNEPLTENAPRREQRREEVIDEAIDQLQDDRDIVAPEHDADGWSASDLHDCAALNIRPRRRTPVTIESDQASEQQLYFSATLVLAAATAGGAFFRAAQSPSSQRRSRIGFRPSGS